jgi:hypothetical protein
MPRGIGDRAYTRKYTTQADAIVVASMNRSRQRGSKRRRNDCNSAAVVTQMQVANAGHW